MNEGLTLPEQMTVMVRLQVQRKAPRTETGPSLRVKTKLDSLNKANVQSDDPVFWKCKRS